MYTHFLSWSKMIRLKFKRSLISLSNNRPFPTWRANPQICINSRILGSHLRKFRHFRTGFAGHAFLIRTLDAIIKIAVRILTRNSAKITSWPNAINDAKHRPPMCNLPILNLLLSNLDSFWLLWPRFLSLESRRARHDQQKKRDEDDDALAAVLLTVAHQASSYNFRRHWVEMKSSHWGINVLRGIILPHKMPKWSR